MLLALTFAVVTAGCSGGGSNPEPSGDGRSELSPSEFAAEYVQHAIDDDQAWLTDFTTSGYYDFSATWLDRLQHCEATSPTEGDAEAVEGSPIWIASVTFEPPCEPKPTLVEVGTTFTLRFVDLSVTPEQVRQTLSDLGHQESQVLTTSDGEFIVLISEVAGPSGPPIGAQPPSERDTIFAGLEEALGPFSVLNFNQFQTVIPAGPFYCVLLRVVEGQKTTASVTGWPLHPGHCSPDSSWFATGSGDPSFGPSYALIEADVSALPPGTDVDDTLAWAAQVLLGRADGYGAPVELRLEGPNRLSAIAMGIEPVTMENLLGGSALLWFREAEEDEDGLIVCRTTEGERFSAEYPSQVTIGVCTTPELTGEVVWKAATGVLNDEELALSGRHVKDGSAQATLDEAGNVVVVIEFTGEGTLLFEQITARLSSPPRPLGIFLDDELISAPQVSFVITQSVTTITGIGSLDDAKDLATLFNSGALPVPVRVIQTSTIDATLGVPPAAQSVP